MCVCIHQVIENKLNYFKKKINVHMFSLTIKGYSITPTALEVTVFSRSADSSSLAFLFTVLRSLVHFLFRVIPCNCPGNLNWEN